MTNADEKKILNAIWDSLVSYGLAGGWEARVQCDEHEARVWLIPIKGRTVHFRAAKGSSLVLRVDRWAKDRTRRGRSCHGGVMQ